MAASRRLHRSWRPGLLALIAALVLTWGYNATPVQALTLSPPAVLTFVNDPGQPGAVVNYLVQTNNVTGTPNVFCTPASGSFFVLGTTSVQCTGSDSGPDEPSSIGFDITVEDVEPPTITVPADITTGGGAAGAIVTFNATATDNSGSAQVTCVPPSGSLFPLGTTTVMCTAMDFEGLTDSDTFTVTVVLDAVPPTIEAGSNITVSNDPGQFGAVVNYPAPLVSDNNPGVTAVCVPASASLFPGETVFPQQGTTVTCTATDIAGNTATDSFTVTVLDVEPPTITAPETITRDNALGQAGAFVTYPPPVVSDNGPGANFSCSPESGAFFAMGTTIVTCTATDPAGNTASASFSVTVLDTEPPVLTLPGSVVVTPNVLGATITYPPPGAKDNVGATVTCTVPSGASLPPGTHTITCTATDAAGNTDSESFTVRVQTPPPFLNPLPGAAATPTPTATPTATPTSSPTASATPSPTSAPTTPVATATPPTQATGGSQPPGTGTPLPPRTGNGFPAPDEHRSLLLLLSVGLLFIAGGSVLALARRK